MITAVLSASGLRRIAGMTVLLAGIGQAFAAQAADDVIGRIKVVRGDAFIISDNSPRPAKTGMEIVASDTLRTGAAGRMGVTFTDSTRFALGPNSEVSVDSFSFNSTTHEGQFDSKISKGSLSVISGKIAKAETDAMTVRTPTSILGVRGTNFLVKVD